MPPPTGAPTPAARQQKCLWDSHLLLKGAWEHALHKHQRPQKRPCQKLRLFGHCPRPQDYAASVPQAAGVRHRLSKPFQGLCQPCRHLLLSQSVLAARAQSRGFGNKPITEGYQNHLMFSNEASDVTHVVRHRSGQSIPRANHHVPNSDVDMALPRHMGQRGGGAQGGPASHYRKSVSGEHSVFP